MDLFAAYGKGEDGEGGPDEPVQEEKNGDAEAHHEGPAPVVNLTALVLINSAPIIKEKEVVRPEHSLASRMEISAYLSVPMLALDSIIIHLESHSYYRGGFCCEMSSSLVDHRKGTVYFNPTVDQLFAPTHGPYHPNKRATVQPGQKNTLTGFVESDSLSDHNFQKQFLLFQQKGYASNPANPDEMVGKNAANAAELEAEASLKPNKKRKKVGGDPEDRPPLDPTKDPSNIAEYLGPWGKRDESLTGAPGVPLGGAQAEEKLAEEVPEEEKSEEDENKPSKKRPRKEEFVGGVLHIANPRDSLGRSFLEPPKELATKSDKFERTRQEPIDKEVFNMLQQGSDMSNLDVVKKFQAEPEMTCYVPKKKLHTYSGHTKGVSRVQLFPRYGHLLLSSSMDGTVKLWDIYNKRQNIMTYQGHFAAVRDVCFNHDGTQFLSASYDKDIRLWDTETGKCLGTYSTKRIPFVVKFHPHDDNSFLVGQGDKKIAQWNIKSNRTEQEYDRHLGAVNTVTFIDDGRRFVSTSDDKSIRVWEFGIPVEIKYIAEPHMHSMPAVGMHPSKKWMLMQSMDNQILMYGTTDKYRLNRKKRFTGHINAGFAIQPNVSPDGRYVISGDGEGRLWIWDYKSCKVVKRIQCHDQVLIDCVWHPHETSKIITASWDGNIHLWD